MHASTPESMTIGQLHGVIILTPKGKLPVKKRPQHVHKWHKDTDLIQNQEALIQHVPLCFLHENAFMLTMASS